MMECVKRNAEPTGCHWTYIAFRPMMKLKGCFEVFSMKEKANRMRHKKTPGAVPSWRIAILIAIFFLMCGFASAQSIPSRTSTEPSPAAPSDQSGQPKKAPPPPLMAPLKPQTQEAPYDPITARQSLRWFITHTVGPP